MSKVLPRKEEKALEAIYNRLEAWAVRNEERICNLSEPSLANDYIGRAATALSSAVETIVPVGRRWEKKDGKGKKK